MTLAPQKLMLDQNSQLPNYLKFRSLIFQVSMERENWCQPLLKIVHPMSDLCVVLYFLIFFLVDLWKMFLLLHSCIFRNDRIGFFFDFANNRQHKSPVVPNAMSELVARNSFPPSKTRLAVCIYLSLLKS